MKLPVLLSDIPSHREIESECKDLCEIFNLSNGKSNLVELLTRVNDEYQKGTVNERTFDSVSVFSAKSMSEAYQNAYLESLKKMNNTVG